MAKFKIAYEEMSDEALLEIFYLQAEMEEKEREDTLARLVETAILIEGKKGRGKTVSAVGLSYEIRERFGRGVVCVGTKMGLNEKFGPFEYLSEGDFRDEMERITVASKEEESAERVADMFDKHGISILYKTIVFDEAYKLFNNRSPMDKLIQLTGFFVAQQRHYHVTTIFLTPTINMVDKRVQMQIDWKGRVYHNKYTHRARLRMVSGLDTLTYDIDCASDAEHVPFYEMYDSWNLVGFRSVQTNIKGL